jgi:SAM-dependent methyltransferase
MQRAPVADGQQSAPGNGSDAASETPAATIARLYDLDLEGDSADVDMYLAFAGAASGPILELMAGTGRVAVPLAAAGHRVVAVDRDPAMLERAAALWHSVRDRAQEGGSLELVEADVLDAAREERFDLVIVALNGLLLLDGRDAQRDLLARIAGQLAPDGRAVIDVWMPAPDDLALYDGRIVLDWVRDDGRGVHVAKQTSATYESGTRVAHVTSLLDEWRDGGRPTRTMRRDTITFVSAEELKRYAADAGLQVETIAGDYEMGHFAADSERVVMVCRPRAG